MRERRSSISDGDLHDVFGLGAFWSVGHFEFNFLSLDQRFISIAGDSAVMHEYILLTGLFDKTITLSVVEPLDQTDSFRHFQFLLKLRKIYSFCSWLLDRLKKHRPVLVPCDCVHECGKKILW